jgi:hypothetical protein
MLIRNKRKKIFIVIYIVIHKKGKGEKLQKVIFKLKHDVSFLLLLRYIFWDLLKIKNTPKLMEFIYMYKVPIALSFIL